MLQSTTYLILILLLWAGLVADAWTAIPSCRAICRRGGVLSISAISAISSTSSSSSSSSSSYPSGTSSSGSANSSCSWGSSRSTSGGPSGVPSKTAMESAVNVEWEPMSELERRIEDGVHYEHLAPSSFGRQQRQDIAGVTSRHSRTTFMGSDDDGNGHHDDSLPRARGIFCGYRYTQDDYNRLKSAHPQ